MAKSPSPGPGDVLNSFAYVGGNTLLQCGQKDAKPYL